MSRRCCTLLIALLLCCPCSDARDLVVDNLRGSDIQNDRGFVADAASYGPYRSIGRALLAVRPGDRIVLTASPEPYRECISLVGPNHSGTPTRPFEIIGNGAVLDGATIPEADAWQHLGRGIWELNHTPPGMGLVIHQSKVLPKIDLSANRDLNRLEPLTWTRHGGAIQVRLDETQSPDRLPLEVTWQTTGITLYDVQHVVIRDLVVRGYRIDGINAHDRCEGITLVNVSSRHNGRSGITVAGASRVAIGATLSEQNGESQLRVEGRGIARLGNVDFPSGPGKDIALFDGGKSIPLETGEGSAGG